MKSYLSGGLCLALCLSVAGSAPAQYGSPSLLPLPDVKSNYYASHHNLYAGATNPAPQPVPAAGAPYPVPAPPHAGHHPGPGCSSCGSGMPMNMYGAGPAPGAVSDVLSSPELACGIGPEVSPNWYVGVTGLAMYRVKQDSFTWSFYDTNEAIQLNDVREASMDWAGGVDFRIGRLLDCGQTAIEFGYWGLYPGEQEHSVEGIVGANLNGIHNWNDLSIDPGGGIVAVNTLVDNAEIHRIRRNYDIHNFELNLLHFVGCGAGGNFTCCGPGLAGNLLSSIHGHGGCGCHSGCGGHAGCGCAPRIQGRYQFMAGIRYFHFGEEFEFAADVVDRTFSGSPEELFYDIDVDNDLLGFQVGGDAEVCFWNNLTFRGGAKVGVYANHISHQSRIGTRNAVARINNGPNIDVPYQVDVNDTDMAFLGELNLGVNYRCSPCWNVGVGYRAVGVTGIAIPTDQVYHDFRGINDVRETDSNASLLLHGVFATVEFRH